MALNLTSPLASCYTVQDNAYCSMPSSSLATSDGRETENGIVVGWTCLSGMQSTGQMELERMSSYYSLPGSSFRSTTSQEVYSACWHSFGSVCSLIQDSTSQCFRRSAEGDGCAASYWATSNAASAL